MLSKLLLLGSLALQVAAVEPPKLKLPWGTYQAELDPSDEKIYRFKNVRFGAEPQRFGAPAFPDWKDDKVQPQTEDVSCIQIKLGKVEHPPGGRRRQSKTPQGVKETEDCLFLDIHVPVAAFHSSAKPLPIIVWIFGGAYAFGNKNPGDPFYTGRSIIKATDYKAIHISGNYRTGAFGFLAGHYMERAGLPNAGLHDQALLFKWVQDYAHLVGGNKNKVTAWGESAGAGSILHHLIREDGGKDPLFHTYAALSPAFEWAWDNNENGRLDTMYKNFSRLSGCEFEYNIDCLRSATIETLTKANTDLFNAVRQTGLFPVGPAVDGTWVKRLPTLSLSQGKYWKNARKAIVTHVADESTLFTPQDIDSQEKFDAFLEVFLPGDELKFARDDINKQYDCPKKFAGNFQACINTAIRDTSFTCNTRDLFEAYPKKTHMMEYAFPFEPLALHGSDLAPLYTNSKEEAQSLLELLNIPRQLAELYAGFLQLVVTPYYQNYFASFAVEEDPNKLRPIVQWPIADGSKDQLSKVLRVVYKVLPISSFFTATDDQNTRSGCLFWSNLAKKITEKTTSGLPDREL